MCRLAAAASAQRLLNVARESAILAVTRLPERINQGVVRPGIDARRCEHTRVSAGVDDLCPETLEPFPRGGRLREHVDGLFYADGAKLPQLPPRPHAHVRRLGRELMHHQQPA